MFRVWSVCGLAASAAFCFACNNRGQEPRDARVRPATATAQRAAPASDGKRAALPSPFAVGASPAAIAATSPGLGIRLGPEFEAQKKRYADLTYAELTKKLGSNPSPDAPLGFDPTGFRYFDSIEQQLRLTAEERAVYAEHGVVALDHQQRYSMGSAYYAIYARDLPVLITTDSVLHALHRSIDAMLAELESHTFSPILEHVLSAAHVELAERVSKPEGGILPENAADADVYLAVARNLLAGAGAARSRAPLAVPSKLGNDAEVKALLNRVASLKLEVPPEATRLYGGVRPVDYSQFRPRGHYTESEPLKKYFRAVVWLGRADLGFVIAAPGPRNGLNADVDRELGSAALLTLLLKDSGVLAELGGMRALIDFLVGNADNLGIEHMLQGLERAGVERAGELAGPGALEELRKHISALDPGQAIRSQVLISDPFAPAVVVPPSIFQLFGQRLLLDSFVLQNVVFDAISYRGRKMRRTMPSGLDVMAALGNDRAVAHLEPDVERYKYGANLLAARRTLERIEPDAWRANVYNLWLDSLRTLDDPSDERHFPTVMRRAPWRDKQLTTQLASWTELRHDTVLYGKQSYTVGTLCSYPAGYVEPYPEFFARLEHLAREAADGIGRIELPAGDPKISEAYRRRREWRVAFFRRFADVMKLLGRLAEKELRAAPFSLAEQEFLQRTIDVRMRGSGGPAYDGWYPQLFYSRAPADFKPVVVDVHSDVDHDQVLEAGVGDVNFLVVAVDNESDRAAYVGPVYSYYEFRHPAAQRMTDEEWTERIETGRLPPRPSWSKTYRAPPEARKLGPVSYSNAPRTPRGRELEALKRRWLGTKDAALKQNLLGRIRKLEGELRRPDPPL